MTETWITVSVPDTQIEEGENFQIIATLRETAGGARAVSDADVELYINNIYHSTYYTQANGKVVFYHLGLPTGKYKVRVEALPFEEWTGSEDQTTIEIYPKGTFTPPTNGNGTFTPPTTNGELQDITLKFLIINGQGTTNFGQSGIIAKEGTTHLITAIPVSGSKFDYFYWDSRFIYENPIQITLTENMNGKTLEISFTGEDHQKPPITTNGNGTTPIPQAITGKHIIGLGIIGLCVLDILGI